MKSLLRVLHYLRPYRGMAVLTLICAALVTALELVPPWLVKIVIDDVIQARRPDLLPWVIAALVLAFAFKNLFASFSSAADIWMLKGINTFIVMGIFVYPVTTKTGRVPKAS